MRKIRLDDSCLNHLTNIPVGFTRKSSCIHTFCDHNACPSQTDRRTDGRTDEHHDNNSATIRSMKASALIQTKREGGLTRLQSIFYAKEIVLPIRCVTSLPKVIWEQGRVAARLPGGRLPARLEDM